MTIDVISDAAKNAAALYDTTTGIVLTTPVFPSQITAEHFLIWAKREGREPFVVSDRYDFVALFEAVKEWEGKYLHDKDLTDQGYDEWSHE